MVKYLHNMIRHKSVQFHQGFTLMELLVVVGIIGLLASIVMAALTNSRGKATDSKIKSQLTSMRNQVELYNGTGTAFAVNTCVLTAGTIFGTTNNGIGNLIPLPLANTRCYAAAGLPNAGTRWAVAVLTTTGVWCADWTGASRDRTTAGVAYTTLALTIPTDSCS